MVSNETNEAKSVGAEPKLFGLPLIILRLILEQLYQDKRAALLMFRLTSRLCQSEADILLFRSVRICEPELRDRKYPQWLLDRLGNSKDTLAGHVRHLHIGPFYKKEEFYNEFSSQLEQILSNLRELRSLSWNTDILISKEALEAFHRTCPTAQLHVAYLTRPWKPIDRRLLSSSQLHSLDMDLHCVADNISAEIDRCSTLPILKQCLLEGNSVKVLRLRGCSTLSPILFIRIKELKRVVTSWGKGPLNFHFHDGDRFPALQEFYWNLSDHTCQPYDFSAEECRMWSRCTDWSRLRVLGLGFSVDALPFFEILTGATPNLRRLTFGNRQHDADISTVSRFLSAITALDFVCFRCSDNLTFLKILSTAVRHHSHALKEMDIGVFSGMSNWSRQQYEDLFEKAPLVSHLKMVLNHSLYKSEEFEGEWVASGTNLTPRQKYSMMKKVSPKPMIFLRGTPQFGLPWQE